MTFMAETSVNWLNGDLIDLLVPFVPILPYLAMFAIIFTGLFAKNYKINAWIGVIANLGSWLISMLVLLVFVGEFLSTDHFPVREVEVFTWLAGSGWEIKAGFLLDSLSVIMIALVSTLGLLIQVYGVAYMDGEEGTKSGRYNAEISLFVGSMLLLSLSANFVIFFIGWELMGVCSYLLIGFFTKKKEKDEKGNEVYKPASAAKKAFMITKIGDILLMSGFLLFAWQMWDAGASQFLNFIDTRAIMAGETFHMDSGIQTLIGLLIFGGAVGKSAQFPLHIWLPDAMEGPTTVSALIHSATMVKAGVFLVARTFYIFEGTDALLFVGVVGAFTAIFAASLAFVATDIKRVLAYSTVSQLGYMFLGLGAYSLTAGMFHLISHSIFKCLLFLGAGSIIHGVHSNDMRDMGGLRPYMKWTHLTFLIGGLGLTGIIPANGFFSKDAVIGMAIAKWLDSGDLLYLLMGLSGLITALMTGFYFFRMYFRVFGSKFNKTKDEEPEHHDEGHGYGLPHESPSLMTIPLVILASLVLITGILSLEGFIANVLIALGIFTTETTLILGNLNLLNEHILGDLLHDWILPHGHPTHIDFSVFLSGWLWVLALGLALLGIFLAWQMYSPGKSLNGFKDSFTQSTIAQAIDGLLVKKYYMDDLFLGLATFFREGVADGFVVLDDTADYIVDGIGRKTADFCDYAVQADENIIDGAVRYLSNSAFRLAGRFRKWQSGVLQGYISSLSFGILIIFLIVVALTWS